jgi:hypothetical protein
MTFSTQKATIHFAQPWGLYHAGYSARDILDLGHWAEDVIEKPEGECGINTKHH